MLDWLSFLSYVAVTAFTPGPNNIASMSMASRLGFRRSYPFNLGVLTGFAAVMLLCTLFCSVLSGLIPKIRFPMLIIGALYMLWLAWKTYKSPAEISDSETRGGYLAGLALQFVNPKIYIYCIVSMEAYIMPVYAEKPAVLVGFALMLAFVGFLSNICWALFGSVFRTLFSKYAKVVNTVMALLLVYCAVSLFL